MRLFGQSDALCMRSCGFLGLMTARAVSGFCSRAQAGDRDGPILGFGERVVMRVVQLRRVYIWGERLPCVAALVCAFSFIYTGLIPRFPPVFFMPLRQTYQMFSVVAVVEEGEERQYSPFHAFVDTQTHKLSLWRAGSYDSPALLSLQYLCWVCAVVKTGKSIMQETLCEEQVIAALPRTQD